MQQTLSKVKNLKKYIEKHGEDAFFSQTISKMLSYRIQKYSEDIERLDKELKRYECEYKKDSSAFFKEFNDGKIGDEMDFVEWASLYQMRNRISEKKMELEGKD